MTKVHRNDRFGKTKCGLRWVGRYRFRGSKIGLSVRWRWGGVTCKNCLRHAKVTHRRAEVWDGGPTGDTFSKAKGAWNHREIGVNWPAYGPVCPSEARKVARAILRCADMAERRIKLRRKQGWTVNGKDWRL